MYQISDQQIDYILNDISARGVEMESLQQNLVDHICCIIEHHLEENGDFENFYQQTIQTFYKDELWEIEEETLQLLTFKNYYTMKKIMIYSGIFSAAVLSFGIFLKFMHWPGASACILLGVVTGGLLFLPLLFTLKAKEKQNKRDKLMIGLGTLSGILMSFAILFKIMYWPHANNLALISMGILLLVFLPMYFINGIRKAETKVNTIVVSILIIMASGLFFSLVRAPKTSRMKNVLDTKMVMQQQQILQHEKQLVSGLLKKDSALPFDEVGQDMIRICETLTSQVLKTESGTAQLVGDVDANNTLIEEHMLLSPFGEDSVDIKNVEQLIRLTEKYNQGIGSESGNLMVPVSGTFMEYYQKRPTGMVTVLSLLQQLTQVQMIVLQNEVRSVLK